MEQSSWKPARTNTAKWKGLSEKRKKKKDEKEERKRRKGDLSILDGTKRIRPWYTISFLSLFILCQHWCYEGQHISQIVHCEFLNVNYMLLFFLIINYFQNTPLYRHRFILFIREVSFGHLSRSQTTLVRMQLCDSFSALFLVFTWRYMRIKNLNLNWLAQCSSLRTNFLYLSLTVHFVMWLLLCLMCLFCWLHSYIVYVQLTDFTHMFAAA